MHARWRPTVLQQLTLWNSGVLALVLTVFAAAAWFTLQEVLTLRSASAVRESARAVAGAIRAGQQAIVARGEVERERGETEQAVLRELRAGDLDIFIADEADQLMAARQPRAERVEQLDGRIDADRPATPIVIPVAVRALMDDVRRRAATGQLADSAVTVSPLALDGEPARAAVLRLPPLREMQGEPTLLVVALRSDAEDRQLLRQVRTTLLLAVPLALLASLVAGFLLARRSLAPLEAINARTSPITAANLDERLPVLNPRDELGRLASIINDLLARVGVAFSAQRQFVADASHELRTPIAIIRGEADVTLRREHRSEAEYREALGVIRDESVRLTQIVDDLFLLARVDAGPSRESHRTLDLRDLVLEAARRVRSLAAGQQVTIETQVPSGAVSIVGDEPLLHRLLMNLLDNALKHAPAASTITVSVDPPRDRTVALRVRDTGPGVPPALRDRLFERFVHGPSPSVGARATPEPRGAGLGLAIAHAIVQAHRGRIALLDGTPGATFEVLLPVPASGEPVS